MFSESGPSRARFTWPKADRILKRSQFQALADRGTPPAVKIRTDSFLVVGRPNDLARHRLGVTVTKKIGAAVTRNRLKRQVREFFRQNRHQWPGGLDLAFIALQPAGGFSRARLGDDLALAGRRLRHFQPKTVGEAPLPPRGEPGPAASPGPNRDAPPAGPASERKVFAARPPGLGWLALGLIYVYQRGISPLFPPCCRFWPTCSNYAASAITIHGFWRGSYLAARRLLKCHPFHPGGYDPVPPAGETTGKTGPDFLSRQLTRKI